MAEHRPPEFRWIPFETWMRLRDKAEAEGVTLEPAPRSRVVMVARNGERSYVVDERHCSCQAAENGYDCKHRALYLWLHFERLVAKYGSPPEVEQRRRESRRNRGKGVA